MMYFTIDNGDLKIDAAACKNQLHGTVIVVYQKKEKKKKEDSNLVIVRNSKSESKRSKDPIYKVIYCQ